MNGPIIDNEPYEYSYINKQGQEAELYINISTFQCFNIQSQLSNVTQVRSVGVCLRLIKLQQMCILTSLKVNIQATVYKISISGAVWITHFLKHRAV